jgi:TatA/E family protein of Tat protein translocase
MGLGLENPIHWVFLLLIVLLVFGARRLPEMGRSLGSGLREFKSALMGEGHEPKQPLAVKPPAATPPPPAESPAPAVEPAPAATPPPVEPPAPAAAPARQDDAPPS